MARQLVVLALVIVAILGLASAEAPASAPAALSGGAALAPIDDNTIGAVDNSPIAGDDAVEAPVGGPVSGPLSVVDGPAQAPSAESSATVAKVSAIAAVAAISGYFF